MPLLDISLSGLATLAHSAADLLRSGKRVTGPMGRSIARPAMQGLFKTHCYARSFKDPCPAGSCQAFQGSFYTFVCASQIYFYMAWLDDARPNEKLP